MDQLVLPTPRGPKTIGVLNIVFGSLLLLCIPCVGAYMALIANLGSIMAAQTQAMQAQQKAMQQQSLADLAQREAEAATEAEKAQIQSERQALLTRPTQPAMPNMDLMTGGMKDPRVVAHYVADFGSGMLLNVLMLAAGIGLVRLREWGRRMSLWVAGLKLARLLAVTASVIVVVVPVTTRNMQRAFAELQQQAGPAPAQGQPNAAEMAQSLGTMSTVYAIGLLILGAIYPAITLAVLTRPGSRAACQQKRPVTDADLP
ncbi:MAG TPA: hypothetical protein VF590_08610 [Isosphaeraceae bacterium]